MLHHPHRCPSRLDHLRILLHLSPARGRTHRRPVLRPRKFTLPTTISQARDYKNGPPIVRVPLKKAICAYLFVSVFILARNNPLAPFTSTCYIFSLAFRKTSDAIWHGRLHSRVVLILLSWIVSAYFRVPKRPVKLLIWLWCRVSFLFVLCISLKPILSL